MKGLGLLNRRTPSPPTDPLSIPQKGQTVEYLNFNGAWFMDTGVVEVVDGLRIIIKSNKSGERLSKIWDKEKGLRGK